MASNIPGCSICQQRHQIRPAVIWCNDCDEGLCGECQENHRLSKGSKNHDTVLIENYVQLPSDVLRTAQLCDEHSEKFVSFCRKHDCACCAKCLIEQHNRCVDIVHIDDVVGNIKSSEIVRRIERTLRELSESLARIITDRKENVDSLKAQRVQIEDNIRKARENINTHLDQIQNDLMKKLKETEDQERKKIQKFVASLKKSEVEINKMREDINKIKQHASNIQTFVSVKQLESKISDNVNHLQSVNDRNEMKSISILWKCQEELANFPKHFPNFGNVIKEDIRSNVSFTFKKNEVAQLAVATPVVKSIEHLQLTQKQTVNTFGTVVTGCSLLPDGRMVFLCKNKNKLYFFRSDGTKDKEVHIEAGVFDVSYNNKDNSLIISTGSSGILEIDINNGKIKRTIDVCELIGGIDSEEGTVVYCTNGAIKRNRLDDETTTTILSTDVQWNDYVTTFNNKIYFTNYKTNTLTCCDSIGTIQWTFCDTSLMECPCGISVDNDSNVYVAGRDSNNVVVLSPDGTKGRTILTSEDGLEDPETLYYDRQRNKLFVPNKANCAFLYCVKYQD